MTTQELLVRPLLSSMDDEMGDEESFALVGDDMEESDEEETDETESDDDIEDDDVEEDEEELEDFEESEEGDM